jgi:hypothetical protein
MKPFMHHEAGQFPPHRIDGGIGDIENPGVKNLFENGRSGHPQFEMGAQDVGMFAQQGVEFTLAIDVLGSGAPGVQRQDQGFLIRS